MGYRSLVWGIMTALIWCSVRADDDSLCGRIVDERSQPLIGAYVSLLSMPDSTYLGSATSDKDGRFSISTAYIGDGLVTTRLFGYDDNYQRITLPLDTTLEIQMQPTSAELKEVVVEGRAPRLTHEAGKFIFTPGALRDFASNSLDLITLAPMIGGGGSGLSIVGKGNAKIYINGKDPHIPTAGVLAELKSYPPSAVKRIEVITAPGAVVSGDQGIINIVLEYPYEGLIGTISAPCNIMNGLLSTSPTAWIGYRRGPVSLSTYLKFVRSDNSSYNSYSYDYIEMPLTIVNTSKGKNYTNGYGGSFTLQYELNKRNNIGITAILQGSQSKSNMTTTTIETRDGVNQETYYKAGTETPFSPPAGGVIMFYSLSTDNKGSGLEISGDFSFGANKSRFFEDFNGNIRHEARKNSYTGFTGKAEYTQYFNNRTELIGGYEIFGNNNYDGRNSIEIANNYHYRKLVNTVYLQYNGCIGSRIGLRLGLRLENMYDKGVQKSEDMHFSHNYTYLVPSLSLSYSLPRSQSVSLELRKDYWRPFFSQYNPYKNWNSENSYTTGNPELKPSQSFNTQIYYSFPWGLIFNARYNYTWDQICQIELPDGKGLSVGKPLNFGHSNLLEFSIHFKKLLTPFWYLSVSGAAMYTNTKTKSLDHNMGFARWMGNLTWGNNFRIPGGLNGGVSFNLQTPSWEGLAKIPWQYALSLGMSKSFKFGLSASAYLYIPLNKKRNAQEYETSEYFYSQTTLDQKYSLNLSLSYTFGKRTVRAPKARELNTRN